jgi:hypothetical protein
MLLSSFFLSFFSFAYMHIFYSIFTVHYINLSFLLNKKKGFKDENLKKKLNFK